MQRLIASVFVVLTLLYCVSCQLNNAGGDEKAIRQNAKLYAEAYNKRDAEKLANLFAEDAIYINARTGERVEGRKRIQEEFVKEFSQEDVGNLTLNVESVTIKGPGQAEEKGTSVMSQPNIPDQKNTYRALLKKIGDQWFIAEVTVIDVRDPISHYDKLKELNWLIGKWVDKDEDTVITLKGKWDIHKNFLTQKFKVRVHDQFELEGFQIIGWDPIDEKIRSWVFDSDGGFGEGTWSKQGGDWVVELVQTLPDGQIGTSINIYSKIGRNTYTWESTGREVGGVILPDIEPVVVNRKS